MAKLRRYRLALMPPSPTSAAFAYMLAPRRQMRSGTPELFLFALPNPPGRAVRPRRRRKLWVNNSRGGRPTGTSPLPRIADVSRPKPQDRGRDARHRFHALQDPAAITTSNLITSQGGRGRQALLFEERLLAPSAAVRSSPRRPASAPLRAFGLESIHSHLR